MGDFTILLIVLWLKSGSTTLPDPHAVLLPPGVTCDRDVALEVFHAVLDTVPDRTLYLQDDYAYSCNDTPPAPPSQPKGSI